MSWDWRGLNVLFRRRDRKQLSSSFTGLMYEAARRADHHSLSAEINFSYLSNSLFSLTGRSVSFDTRASGMETLSRPDPNPSRLVYALYHQLMSSFWLIQLSLAVRPICQSPVILSAEYGTSWMREECYRLSHLETRSSPQRHRFRPVGGAAHAKKAPFF